MGGRGSGTGRTGGSTGGSNINVGSSVTVGNSSRVGVVTRIRGDVATVEFAASGTNMSRTDQYYLNELRIRR